jgi:hypothetical protein
VQPRRSEKKQPFNFNIKDLDVPADLALLTDSRRWKGLTHRSESATTLRPLFEQEL